MATADRLRLDVLGRGVVIDSDDPQVIAAIGAAWSRCRSDGPPQDDDIVLAADEAYAYVNTHQADALAMRLTSEAIQAGVGSRVMLHAAAVADGTGAVLAMVGPSGMGKTTAAMRLARGRFGYVTDEIVSVDAAGAVAAFARPLLLEDPEPPYTGKSQHTPDELGLQRCRPPLRLARLVLLERSPEAGPAAAADVVPLLDGLLKLIAQTSMIYSLNRPLQRLCQLADLCGGIVRLTYRDIDEAADVVEELLRGAPAPAQAWTDPGHRPAPEGSVAWGLMDGRVRRKPYLDAVQVGDEALLMIRDTPIRLSGIGLTVWLNAASAPTMSELVDVVVSVHGPHPEAETLVRDAVAALAGADVLGFDRPHPLIGDDVDAAVDRLPQPPQAPAPLGV